MRHHERISIGRINYTNVWPIFHHFPEERFAGEVVFSLQVPTGLNRAMAAGEVDMGAMSSFAYGTNFDEYLLFPGLSVSALGRVNSLLLFHRKPLEQIAGGTFALSTASATTVNLLKILLAKRYEASPTYLTMEPSLDKMMAAADGALLIGDDAIRASWADHGYMVTDLGELWKAFTGEWMTFAVWAVRKDTVRRNPELVSRIHEAFQWSKEHGLRHPEGMIAKAQATIGGTESYWRGYFNQLTYEFGPDQWRGLSLYFSYAKELGLLERDVPIQLWEELPAR
ncbi:menaquinone biosynthesis protein [Paenibacillus contaminans]|uniref:Chorismate dehydratase n=1 Tax=Paenibacillus contaminans TaxID=450362 RepID=A0A329MEX1_9BACL|nr:menaquinone biosynthesis protein [Paenibacillus contaminans]RAV18525.1 ABC transporter substrate-binding protein [Paenibacillus contaminans]